MVNVSLYDIPSIDTNFLCIAADPILAAIISSYFNFPNEYFCVLESPRMKRIDNTNEVIKRNNVAALMKPQKIILAGLDEEAIVAFQGMVSSHRLILVHAIKDIQERVEPLVRSECSGELVCNDKELSTGLLLAKHLKKRLVVKKSAKSIIPQAEIEIPKSDHQILLDDNEGIAPIITANYAYSINAGLSTFPQPSDDEIDSCYEDILNSTKLGGTIRGKKSKRSLISKNLIYNSYFSPRQIKAKLVTFITRGIPYGYFFPDVPSTHLYSYPELGNCIFLDIYYARYTEVTRSALILDPGFFKKTETEFISNKLIKENVYVKQLKGKEALVYRTGQFIQWFPYDLLFICSHAGEMDGKLLCIKFEDRNGAEHEIAIEFAAGFGVTDEGIGMNRMVEVHEFIGFVELDGFSWQDKSKQIPNSHEVVEDFLKVPHDKWNVIRRTDIKSVRRCQAIKLTDHYYQPAVHSIASQENPIIFNNACTSFYEFSGRFIFAGARGYVGTLTEVDNSKAKAVAEKVFKNLSDLEPLSLLLWKAQRDIYPDPQDRVYVHIGCHFNNIRTPKDDPNINTRVYLTSRIATAIQHLNRKLKKNKLPQDVIRNIGKGLDFLIDILSKI